MIFTALSHLIFAASSYFILPCSSHVIYLLMVYFMSIFPLPLYLVLKTYSRVYFLLFLCSFRKEQWVCTRFARVMCMGVVCWRFKFWFGSRSPIKWWSNTFTTKPNSSRLHHWHRSRTWMYSPWLWAITLGSITISCFFVFFCFFFICCRYLFFWAVNILGNDYTLR